MKRRVPLILLTLALAAPACQRPRTPEFRSLRNLELRSASLDGTVSLEAEAIFDNPNPVSLKVTEMELHVFVDGKPAADVRQTVTATMTAGSEFALPIQIDIPFRAIYDDAGDFLGGALSGKTVTVRVGGGVTVTAAGLELDVPIEYEREYSIGR